MTESENENDLLDLDHRDHKIFSKKVGERFVDRNEKFVPLHCRKERRRGRAGQRENVFRPDRIYCLPSAQKRSPEIGRES